MQSRVWPAHLPRIPQGGGDLGVRMARILRNMPQGPVCIVGGDIPAITRRHINHAFNVLGSHDAVFGPATDGGYWLVGMKRVASIPVGLFNDVRWSTEFALSDSVATLNGASVGYVDQLSDIDTFEDLQRLRKSAQAR